MKKVTIFIGIIILVVLVVVVIFLPRQKAVAPTNDQNQSVSDYKNGTYEIDGQKITLKNGEYRDFVPGSSAPMTFSYFGNEAIGDVNGDGKEDVAFILVGASGGTGVFYYATVALKTNTDYVGTNAIFLGDRIAPQNMEIKNGVLIANYAERLPKEPMVTEPSLGVSKYLKIENGVLVEIKGEMGE